MAPAAEEVLEQLAETAESRPAPTRGGRYAYIRSKGRHRSSQHHLGGDGRLTPIGSEVVLVDRELWIAADGSGRIAETRTGRGGTTSRTSDFEPDGLFHPGFLPEDPDELRRVLPVRGSERGTFTWFVAVREVWASSVVSPRVQAAILRVLATRPDIASRGGMVDAVGRQGVAFSTDTDFWGRPQRYQLLVDATTGSVNEYQVLEIRDDGVPDPGHEASSYTAFIGSSFVDSVGACS